jgi:predicted nucleic acid-binding protein
MILLDTNILVSAVVGTSVRRALMAAHGRGVTLAVPEPQILEAVNVLTKKLGLTVAEAREGLEGITALTTTLGPGSYATMETAARRRLHDRAQSDWPLLAVALASGGAIWSNDRDFFGVGVPVWSSRNMQFAE